MVVAPSTFKPACKSAAPSAVIAAIVEAPSTFNVPLTSAPPVVVILLNVTSSVVATGCPMAISPVALIDTPVPASK